MKHALRLASGGYQHLWQADVLVSDWNVAFDSTILYHFLNPALPMFSGITCPIRIDLHDTGSSMPSRAVWPVYVGIQARLDVKMGTNFLNALGLSRRPASALIRAAITTIVAGS
jgi:hypothetical protein